MIQLPITLGHGLIGTAVLGAVTGIGYLALDGMEARLVEKGNALYLPQQVAEAQYMQIETYERLKHADELRILRREYDELEDISRKLKWLKSKRPLTEDQEWRLEQVEADMNRKRRQIEEYQEVVK